MARRAEPLPGPVEGEVDVAALEEIQRRVLWLAVRMVDAANRERDDAGGIKVGGHQASSASMVTVMTALYFAYLDANDRVSVKPHGSPVLHAIQYLLGNLDASYLRLLRSRGGLQAYPSRTKDPDPVDFSTGSVGLGAAAPLFAALTRRYVDDHFGPRPPSRFIAVIGDAELDEGNVWEAAFDPATAGLGNVMWVVDFNRQSLDRVVPGVRIGQLKAQFSAAGWDVVEVKYGRKLQAAFRRPHGDALRQWIDDMSNEQYQSTFDFSGDELRKRFLEGAPRKVGRAVADLGDEELEELVHDLGGHDLVSLLDAFAHGDRVSDRPSVIFAYTIKGWGLPIAGKPRNHAAMLTPAQIDELRTSLGLNPETEWDAFPPESRAGRLCSQRRRDLARPAPTRALGVSLPERVEEKPPTKAISTQEAFGRLLTGLARHSDVAPYLVTTSPDVAVSTNLAGFINRMGVYAPAELRDWNEADQLLRWRQGPAGQHIELGISEMNLFLLLSQLGLAWDFSDQPLLPIGTLYDPFVCRGLDAFIYALYSGAGFVIVGTPSGVTLSPEGGAHQSTITASIGLELPGVTFIEPAYAGALDWLLCDALARIAAGEPDSAAYLRLSTRPLDQSPFEEARRRLGDEELRRQVLAGGYRLVEAVEAAEAGAPAVHLVGCGAVVPETLQAASELAGEGVAAHVVDVTSLDRLYRAWRWSCKKAVATGRRPEATGILRVLFPTPAPVVTIHDAASHAMAWIGSALGAPAVALGVDQFGQSGSISELYDLHDLIPGRIVNAALVALSRA